MTDRRTHARRASILLEVVIALAIFVIVGLSVSTAMRTALAAAADLKDSATANDIARSAIAQIRAGIADAEALDGAVPADEHAEQTGFADSPEDSPWIREIDTDRSGFANLDAITVTVTHESRPSATVTITALIPTTDPGSVGAFTAQAEAAAGAP